MADDNMRRSLAGILKIDAEGDTERADELLGDWLNVYMNPDDMPPDLKARFDALLSREDAPTSGREE